MREGPRHLNCDKVRVSLRSLWVGNHTSCHLEARVTIRWTRLLPKRLGPKNASVSHSYFANTVAYNECAAKCIPYNVHGVCNPPSVWFRTRTRSAHQLISVSNRFLSQHCDSHPSSRLIEAMVTGSLSCNTALFDREMAYFSTRNQFIKVKMEDL